MSLKDHLKDHQEGDLNHHLRNHVHLTNCIHLKNHIHKHSPMLDERSLMRDLIALGRSRSLRDPSTSPSPLHSPSCGRRRSTGMDHPRISWSSPTRMDVHEASSSSVRAFGRQAYQIEQQGDECCENNATRLPRNGCGIPFSWSRIHHRGKSFLGKSFACGLSDSRFKRGGSISIGPQGSSLCSQFDAEELPLLTPGSGELGLFVDRVSKHENLTQKYMPRMFKDLVGQNLVVQALSNAVMQRKVGALYVFYGPHGTGKTSCARVLAKGLNCESLEHTRPCGICSSCITHDLGQSSSLREVGPLTNFGFESIMDLLDEMLLPEHESHYRVLIFEDCDALSADCWSSISKVIDRAPRRVVFVVICLGLDVLPHMIISRCHKFFFPKLKDIDVIYALQRIAAKEGLEIDRDALKLIASRSDGSLRDAEMTLEQLSLLGQRISVSLVQELVGLISDERLVDLLELALSADTVNTVRNLREIVESGVDPLALISQLATVITDMLAGSYDFAKERRRRRFFRRPTMANEDMEKLRRALKILSEAEKQLRMSNDKLTWLTAALLQLAPERQYMLPGSSTDHSFSNTPFYLRDKHSKGFARKSNMSCSSMSFKKGLDTRSKRVQAESSDSFHEDGYPMLVEMRRGFFLGANAPLISPTSEMTSHALVPREDGLRVGTSEIVEVAATPSEANKGGLDVTEAVEAQILAFCSEQRGSEDQNQCQSLMRSRVSLADVIQRTEKLEQENLRLEPKTRKLRCWKASRGIRRKFLWPKIRRRRCLMKLVCCGRCVSSRSTT